MHLTGFFVSNRADSPAEGGWYHLMPIGELPGTAVGPDKVRRRITQVIDQEALNRIMAQYAIDSADPLWKGYLVSPEHGAHEPNGDTRAFAWVRELKVRNGAEVPERERGVWGRVEKTPLGEDSIGTIYRGFSTVNPLDHIGGDRYRPVAIEDVGLTNRPAFKTTVPAFNRDQHTQEAPMRESLCTKLGLAAGATDEQLLAAVDQVLNRAGQVDTLTTRATAAEQERDTLKADALNRDADAFVAKHAKVIKDPAKVKAAFVANREQTESVIGALGVMEPARGPARVLNRAEASEPSGSPLGATPPADEARAAKVLNRANELVAQRKVPFAMAFNLAEAEEGKG